MPKHHFSLLSLLTECKIAGSLKHGETPSTTHTVHDPTPPPPPNNSKQHGWEPEKAVRDHKTKKSMDCSLPILEPQPPKKAERSRCH